MNSTLITNCGELLTNDPALGDGSLVGRLNDAAFVIEDGLVAWLGAVECRPGL